jgi:hypothetical protein
MAFKIVLHSSDTHCLQYHMDPGFESRSVTDTFSRTSRPVLGPAQPLVHWTPTVLSPAVKRRGRQVGCLPPSNPEVKNKRNCIPAPPVYLDCVHKYASPLRCSNRATRISGVGVFRVVIGRNEGCESVS